VAEGDCNHCLPHISVTHYAMLAAVNMLCQTVVRTSLYFRPMFNLQVL